MVQKEMRNHICSAPIADSSRTQGTDPKQRIILEKMDDMMPIVTDEVPDETSP